ncbi:hypothetical protein OXPF_27280 [Oxobacter pfennigii]|uniref:Uncharacterized protein n=1 Tax=Oxobacter pfennigii TaxID=36849 RepID=A0A0P9ADP6_9CLOT|nr:hypothetical protein [Oxobacter pfennigii]KPU43287.1 hypothetical protein OXPF_27280 [Oxobacter pfennigii]
MKKSVIAIFMLVFVLLIGCGKPVQTNEGNNDVNGNVQTEDETAGKSAVVYTNTQYGFNFSLPDSWKGYTIVDETWEGAATGESDGEKIVENGPLISIRHPQWTAEKPRQDIPIMVFTTEQWNSLLEGKFHIGAAPIDPSELGRNNSYVFALPARYNYSFPEGYEEVEEILKGNPLQPINK